MSLRAMLANWLRNLGRVTSWRLTSYPNNLHDLHNDLPFMWERKLVLNLNDKKKYIIYVMALDQALKHGLVLDKVH